MLSNNSGLPFQILLEDDKKNFYYSGSNINGEVRFKFDKPERAKSLTLYFIGVEGTRYEAPSDENNDGSTQHRHV